ncbi:NUDIX hydrolase [Enterococcus viikkiensis]|uniref:NUDIX hydrolase n=1 Tax=Enterococcus viikkiensis TaxID=930854 RepID=UPI0010F570D5|nr:NUDIX domain-containing protein [Enterococcus viikkiensis]
MKKAYAIVIRNGLILLVRRPGMPIWDLPGGDLLPNENERDGMRRLISELLSFNSTVEDLIGIYTKEHYEEITYIYKVQEAVSQSRMESHDYADFSFFDIHNLPLNVYPDRQRQIKDYLTGRFPVRLRLKENKWLFKLKSFIKEKRK